MTIRSARLPFALLCAALAFPLAAEDKPAAQAPPAPAAGDKAASVEYRPPSRGAPRVRVGGSTRGMARGLRLAVIAPDHTGLSTSTQPELFWYISQAVVTPLEFALYPAEASDPLVETAIAPVPEPGIQRIRLADLGTRLENGEEYEWVISFAAKPGSRIKDAVASGRLRVQSPTPQLSAARELPGAYATYAREGYWYDAFSQLRGEMARRPRDEGLQAAQRSLLEQIGLGDIVSPGAY